MRISKLKYLIGIVILILTFDLNAQKTEMVMNENFIDRNFVVDSEIITKVNNQDNSESEITLLIEKSTDSLFSVFVLNKTTDSLTISTQDLSFYLIQEAKNQNGEWKPIEYWRYSTCGNSYSTGKLEPNGILKSETTAYNGTFPTQIRFKLLNNNKVYFSNSIDSFIYLEQFDIPKSITDNRTFKRTIRLGGENLLKKVMFLEPNGLNELEKKQEEDLAKMIAKKRENKN